MRVAYDPHLHVFDELRMALERARVAAGSIESLRTDLLAGPIPRDAVTIHPEWKGDHAASAGDVVPSLSYDRA